MMLWLPFVVACVLVLGLLWASWRRVSRDVPMSALGLLVVALAVGVAGWLFIGRHPHTMTWLDNYQSHRELARELIDGRPDMEALQQVPAGPMAMVLQRELQRDPSAEGWYGLALIYEQLEASEVAVEAARKAAAQAGATEPAPRMLLARALMEEGSGESLQEARQLLEGVLEAVPSHEGAKLMLGVVAARLGDYDTAVAIWEDMLARHPQGEATDSIRLALEDARLKQAGARRYGTISVTVSAGEAVPAGGTLFVFLRRAGSSGGQPLAARRVLADRLPITVNLGPEHWLQPFPAGEADLVAGARYAATPGSAVAQAGLSAEPVPLQGEPGELSARLSLSPASE